METQTKIITIAHSQTDLILNRWDKNVILEHQGPLLVKHLSGWIYHQNSRSKSCQIFSPILTDKNDLDKEIKKVYDGITKFITDLNKDGKTVSRIECWLDQSNDQDALPHPSNNMAVASAKAQKNQDYKYCNYIFVDHYKTENFAKDTVYGNKFERELNSCKIKISKKYFVLHIKSSWLSI